MKSQLLVFYKFAQEMANNQADPVELDIGLPTKKFELMKQESYALLTQTSNKDLKDVHEFVFNVPNGKLTIYNRDFNG